MTLRTGLLVLILACVVVALVPAVSFADGVNRDASFEDEVIADLLAPHPIDLGMGTASVRWCQ